LQEFWEEKMQGGWHDFEIWKEHQRGLLGEAEARRLVRAVRPDLSESLGKYYRLLDSFAGRILGLGRRVVPSRKTFPPDEEVATSGTGARLVEAIVDERAAPLRSSSVIEFHREAEGYVIREVDLGTGDDILYLSTERPEWAAWIWERKTHR
jgi:hypothetical protein